MTFALSLLFLLMIFSLSFFVLIYGGKTVTNAYSPVLGIQKAFFNVYLPLVLLTPVTAGVKLTEGIPPITIHLAVLIPILLAFFTHIIQYWKFSFLDILVILYVFSGSTSVYLNDGYWPAQSHLFQSIIHILFPYILSKILIDPMHQSVAFAKRFVLIMLINGPIMLLEFLTGYNVDFHFFWKFFQDVPIGFSPTRFGFSRANGPFNHTILAGIVIIIAHRLNRWVELLKSWKSPHYPFSSILSEGRFIRYALIIMLLMTLSRGPMVGAIFGSILFALCMHKKDSFGFALKLLLGFATLYGIYFVISSIASTNEKFYSEEGDWADIGTFIYRSNLLAIYEPTILEHPFFGWGIEHIPIIHPYDSTDNLYIYLALIYGLVGLTLFLVIALWVITRLFWKAAKKNLATPRSLLAYTLACTYLAILITFGTVWMDSQLTIIIFIFIGWCEGFLLANEEKPSSSFQKSR